MLFVLVPNVCWVVGIGSYKNHKLIYFTLSTFECREIHLLWSKLTISTFVKQSISLVVIPSTAHKIVQRDLSPNCYIFNLIEKKLRYQTCQTKYKKK